MARGQRDLRGSRVARECVAYWYSFSNPRTKCIHCDNCLVITKKRFLSFPHTQHTHTQVVTQPDTVLSAGKFGSVSKS
jgi:hypothetical protein